MSRTVSPLYAGRKRFNAIAMALCYAATGFGLMWLALILISLLMNGLPGLTPAIFLESTPPPNVQGGGLANAIVGSLMLTIIGVGIGAPIGILAGTYMAEYGRHSRVTSIIRFINDILLSAPSIIIGLFIYTIVVVPMGRFSGIAGALALAVIVIPVVVRTTEDMLLLVPNPLREAASALGMPRSLVIRQVAYRAARAGIITGVLLAVARVSGETAPLLFTVLSNQFFSLDITQPLANLPVTINNFINNPDPNWKKLAWTGALIITFAVLSLNIGARALSKSRNSK
ncbi:MAG: phosphate ABC transporter permease PstA [Beijerinckiaceae bacterium]|nr:phosphate ABC transporter permease PstA [Beijerinckiaceae bacterium]